MRILLIEDGKQISEIIINRLKRENYAVDAAYDGDEGLHIAEMVYYDAIVLDIMLPKKDGLSVLRELRHKKIKSPVLLLSAKNSVEDKIKGLDAGADDYLGKPFSVDELLARIRALFRRRTENKEVIISEGDLVIDTLSQTVSRAGKKIVMTLKEYTILEYLCRNKGYPVSREQIIEHAWDFDFDSDINIVNVYIRYLRTKIDDDFNHKLIHSVRGRGYLLEWKQ